MVKHPWPLLEISLSDFRRLATLNIYTYLPVSFANLSVWPGIKVCYLGWTILVLCRCYSCGVKTQGVLCHFWPHIIVLCFYASWYNVSFAFNFSFLCSMFITLTFTIMSFGWMNSLLYTIFYLSSSTGNEPLYSVQLMFSS